MAPRQQFLGLQQGGTEILGSVIVMVQVRFSNPRRSRHSQELGEE